MTVTIDNIPVFQALVDDEGTGMLRISLVDSPAVMSDFLAFREEKVPVMYRVQDEEKRLVRGVVMRADFPIYRRDARAGEYYIIYKADTIRIMAEKYLLESRQNNVNLMHEDGSDVDGVQMVQYFIKDSASGVSPEGFDDIADGSLFAEFHVVNDDVWDEIKAGTYKGFSLEGIFDLVPETDKDAVEEMVRKLNGKFNKTTHRDMTKMQKFKNELARLLAMFGAVTTDKGILAWDGDDDLKEGMAVSVEDSEGNRTTAPDGDYKTRDGKTIRVADGKVSQITDPEAEVAGQEQKNRKERMEKMKAAFSMSYNDRMRRIAEELSKSVFDFYIEDAGDDFVVVCEFDMGYNSKYMRYAVTWNGDTPSIGDGREVRLAFVPKEMDIEFTSEQKESLERELSEERERNSALQKELDTAKTDIEEIKAEMERLKKSPQARPAHEEFSGGGGVQKTGNKGLDNLARIMNA